MVFGLATLPCIWNHCFPKLCFPSNLWGILPNSLHPYIHIHICRYPTVRRFSKHVACRPTQSCSRVFRFAEFGGEEKSVEKAKQFVALVKTVLRAFDKAQKAERAEILEKHKAKPKRSIYDTRVAFEIHLYQGLSPHFENLLKEAKAATGQKWERNMLVPIHMYIHTYIHTYVHTWIFGISLGLHTYTIFIYIHFFQNSLCFTRPMPN